MFRRTLIQRVFLAAVLGAAAAPGGATAAAMAEFPRGSRSAGVHGAYALFSMGDVNRILDGMDATQGTRYEELKRGREGALDVRYAFRDQVFIGVEGGYLTGGAEDRTATRGRVEVRGIPLQLIGGGAIGRPSEMVLRIVAGIGVLLDAKLVDAGVEAASGTAFITSLGGELEYRLTRSLALTAQALARQAEVKKPGAIVMDFSGGTFRVGLRGYFGAAAPPR